MMKKALTLVLAGVTALSLTACGGGASASATTAAPAAGGETKAGEAKAPEKDVKTTTLKLAFNQSEKHPQYLALSEMSDAFYEATGGAYRIEISPNELLGSQKDAFELVQSGTIQMAMVANSIVENVNPDFAVLGLPYAYDSVEHQKKVFTSGALDDIFASTEANNFSVMAAFTAGARCIYTDKPVQTPADLKGYKIRVMESQTCIAMLDAMGGVGTHHAAVLSTPGCGAGADTADVQCPLFHSFYSSAILPLLFPFLREQLFSCFRPRSIYRVCQQIADNGMIRFPPLIDVLQRMFLLQQAFELVSVHKCTVQPGGQFAFHRQFIGAVHNGLCPLGKQSASVFLQFRIHLLLQALQQRDAHRSSPPRFFSFRICAGSCDRSRGMDSSVSTYSLMIPSAL